MKNRKQFIIVVQKSATKSQPTFAVTEKEKVIKCLTGLQGYTLSTNVLDVVKNSPYQYG